MSMRGTMTSLTVVSPSSWTPWIISRLSASRSALAGRGAVGLGPEKRRFGCPRRAGAGRRRRAFPVDEPRHRITASRGRFQRCEVAEHLLLQEEHRARGVVVLVVHPDEVEDPVGDEAPQLLVAGDAEIRGVAREARPGK